MVGNTGFEPVAFRTSSGYSPAELIAQTFKFNMTNIFFQVVICKQVIILLTLDKSLTLLLLFFLHRQYHQSNTSVLRWDMAPPPTS